jgi:Family of unknown function (DUF5317)
VIIPVVAILAVLAPAVLGGRLGRLARVRVRKTGVIMCALLVQIFIVEVFTRPAWLLQSAHVATYIAAGWFLWINRRIPGAPLLGLGAASNGVTIILNGGVLPASPSALRSAGLAESLDRFANSAPLTHPRLAFLGDVFAIPASWPLSNVFSIGDVLIIAGAAVASLRICGTHWSAGWLPFEPRHKLSRRQRQPVSG